MTGWWLNLPIWKISNQNGNLPQVGVRWKNWNHHLDDVQRVLFSVVADAVSQLFIQNQYLRKHFLKNSPFSQTLWICQLKVYSSSTFAFCKVLAKPSLCCLLQSRICLASSTNSWVIFAGSRLTSLSTPAFMGPHGRPQRDSCASLLPKPSSTMVVLGRGKSRAVEIVERIWRRAIPGAMGRTLVVLYEEQELTSVGLRGRSFSRESQRSQFFSGSHPPAFRPGPYVVDCGQCW